MNQRVARLILMMMLGFLGVSLGVHTIFRDEDYLVCSIPMLHTRENYKLMIDGGNCTNIIAKTTLEKMGLKAEPQPHP